MAPEDQQSLDPQRSLKRALDSLTQAVKRLDKHFESLESEGQGQYIEQQKESNAAKKVREAGWSVAEAKKPTQPQQQQPGSLNTNASTISEVAASIKASREAEEQTQTPAARIAQQAEAVRAAGRIGRDASQAGPPEASEADDLQSKRMTGLGWMTPEQMEKIREESPHLKGYSYGGFEQKARVLESRAESVQNYAAKASAKAGEHGMTGTAMMLGGAARVAGKISKTPMPLVAGFEIAKKAYQIGNQGVDEGVSLGYSGEDFMGGGQYLPFGLGRNPLSILSEGGKEGIGLKLSAVENAFQGNLGFGQSQKLQKNLAGLGFSNTGEEGPLADVLGLKNRGKNQEMTELGSEAMRSGVGEKQYLGMAAGIRFGGGSIQQLTENIKDLGKVAKNTGASVNVVAESMAEYAQITSKQGTQTAQEGKGKEIFAITGKPAKLTAETNETALGQAAAGRFGILPGTVGATSGAFQAQISSETLANAAQMTRNLKPEGKDLLGHPLEADPKEQLEMHAAEMSRIYGIPVQAAKNFLEHEKRTKWMGTAMNEVNRGINFVKNHPYSDKDKNVQDVTQKSWGELWKPVSELEGAVSDKQFQADWKIDKGGVKSREALKGQLEAASKEQEQEENVKIELAQTAKKFFELQFPDEWKKAQANSRKGGTSSPQNATSPTTGKEANPIKTVIANGS